MQKIVLALLAVVLVCVNCNYEDGQITNGLVPRIVKQTSRYTLYQHVYGIKWSNVYIDQADDRVFLQGEHTRCPNGNACSSNPEYVFLNTKLSTVEIVDWSKQDSIENKAAPQAQGLTHYTPYIIADYAYFMGGSTGSVPLNIYVMNKNTKNIAKTFELAGKRLDTATAVRIDYPGHAVIYAVSGTELLQIFCEEHCMLSQTTPIVGFSPLYLVSDNLDTIMLIASDKTNAHLTIIPIDRVDNSLRYNNTLDLTNVHFVSDTYHTNIVSAFITTAREMFITVQPFGLNETNSGIISKILLSREEPNVRYQPVARRALFYSGAINCYTHNSEVAYFGTNMGNIVRVNLTNTFGEEDAAKTLALPINDQEPGMFNMPVFDSIALSQDNKTLIATVSWWGMIAKLDLTQSFEDDPPVPAGPVLTALWVILGLSIATFILAGILIAGFLLYRARKPGYTNI